MPIFFISLIGAYLIGNVYIFWRGAQAATAFPMGLKVVLALLYVCGALLFFVRASLVGTYGCRWSLVICFIK